MGRSIHRKLFPALSSINQTQDCSDFCDPACPYNCYSFPDYYFPPPPPPPPPLSPPQDSSSGTHIPSYFIILVSLFSVIFVLLGLYVIKAKCCADWYGRRHSVGSISDASDQEFLEENQVDHPIWFITTVGLQQSVINAITVCRYKRGEGLIEGTECSVCLNQFHEGETLRLLPKCNHAFHIPCIDTWLRSHTNCPLCRSGIVSNNSVPPEAVVSNLGSVELNPSNSRRRQEILTENPTNDGELSSNIAVIGNEANRAGTGETQDFADDLVSKEHENVKVFNDETQIEIRSMSMDSRLAGRSCPGPGLANSCTTEFEENPPMFKAIRRSSVGKCLNISPVSMKRSLSCSGRIQSARGYRTQPISLPY